MILTDSDVRSADMIQQQSLTTIATTRTITGTTGGHCNTHMLPCSFKGFFKGNIREIKIATALKLLGVNK